MGRKEQDMSNEELYNAIHNFQIEVMSHKIDKYESTGEAQGDFLRRIDSYQDEFQILNIHGDEEKEAAYAKYIFEMASEEFL
jgi:hypothetical protein